MEFNAKSDVCPTLAEAQRRSVQLRDEWLKALCIRLRMDPGVLEKVWSSPDYPKSLWRDYLLEHFGIQIELGLKTENLTVKRLNARSGLLVVIGEWRRPEIIRSKSLGEGSDKYEIRLSYFSLV